MDVREEVSLASDAMVAGGSSGALRPFQSSARALVLVGLEDGELGALTAGASSSTGAMYTSRATFWQHRMRGCWRRHFHGL